MNTIALIVYITTLILCFSTYLIYPITIWIFGKIYPLKRVKYNIHPTVSIIISAYNEEKYIEKKIRNILNIEYPKEKIEVLIGSDGSSDKTAKISSLYSDENIKTIEFKENRGKTSVQNDLVKIAKGEILIFTDAASFHQPDAITKIISNFADEKIGCVGGKLNFVNIENNITTQSQGLYWRYESKIRELESLIGNLIGVDGPLYAIRKECYVPLEEDIISDLISPLIVISNGKKAVLESDAVVDESTTQKATHEVNTRRRIVLRGMVGLRRYNNLINPIRNPILAVQIIFHKIIRWLVGPIVLIHFCATLALFDIIFFRIALMAYVGFMLVAIGGWICEKNDVRVKPLRIPYYFCLVNIAAFMGFLDYIMKKKAVTWQTVRD